MARRRRGGIGLSGLLVIGALLYFTGAGAWLWSRILQFEESCYAILAEMGTETGTSACAASGAAIRSLDEKLTNWDASIDETIGRWKERLQHFTSGQGFGDVTQSMLQGLMQGSSPLSGLTSPSDKLAAMMQRGPYSVGGGADVSTRVRAALDHFVIGQHYLNDGGSAASALPWLRQGAMQPGYGLYSQLALGDLYRNGGAGVAANPTSSIHYYQQAQQSIGILSQSNSPQAAQMLQGMPASPAAIQQQIVGVIADINKSIKAK